MGLGRLTLSREITRLRRSNSLHLSDDTALTFIQEPVLGACERCGSPVVLLVMSAQIANRFDWPGLYSISALSLLPTVFFDSLRLRFL